MAKTPKTNKKQTPAICTRLHKSFGKINRGINLYEETRFECQRFFNGQINEIDRSNGKY